MTSVRQARRKPAASKVPRTTAKSAKRSKVKSTFKNVKGVNPHPPLPSKVLGFSMPAMVDRDGEPSTQTKYSHNMLHGQSWDATSYLIMAAHGMAGQSWTSGSEMMKLREGEVLEESSHLLAKFFVIKQVVVIPTGASTLGARARGAQGAVRIVANLNGWRVKDVPEYRYYSTSNDPGQHAKRVRVFEGFTTDKLPAMKRLNIKVVNLG